MCLTIKEHEIKVAQKDLHVYKVLGHQPSGFCSLFKTDYYWTEGEVKAVPCFSGKVKHPQTVRRDDETLVYTYDGINYYVDFVDKIPETVHQVYKGLHCYNPYCISFQGFDFNDTVYIANMTIPKHTRYIEGRLGELVSLTLRFDSVFEKVFPGENLRDFPY